MPASLPTADARQMLARLPEGAHRILAFGAAGDGDMDTALEAAVAEAGYELGFSGAVASIAGVDPTIVQRRDVAAVPLNRAVLLALREMSEPTGDAAVDAPTDAADVGTVRQARVVAVPVCADSAFARRRIRVALRGPEQAVTEVTGPLVPVSVDAEAVLCAAATDPWTGTEVLEQVTVATARSRFRPVVEVFRGSATSEYAVLSGDRILSRGHAKAGQARAAAVAMLRSGPVDGVQEASLEVLRLVGRGVGVPYIRVRRTRVDARIVARVVTIAPKKPEPAKTTGWLFFGTAAS